MRGGKNTGAFVGLLLGVRYGHECLPASLCPRPKRQGDCRTPGRFAKSRAKVQLLAVPYVLGARVSVVERWQAKRDTALERGVVLENL
jgi:hypothetical protein